MNIVCPHCTTSYAIDASTLGAAGRSVRCSRCKEVWLARPDEPERAEILVPSVMERNGPAKPVAQALPVARHDPAPVVGVAAQGDPPVVESPSIASDWPTSADIDAPPDHEEAIASTGAISPLPKPTAGRWFRRSGQQGRRTSQKSFGLPLGCVAMAAMVVALIVWRADIVRLLPQTAALYKLVGLEVNLRGLAFKDVKISKETVDNKPVLVIEGNVVSVSRKPVELPRLRFIVRDARGTEIYAWNAVLEQPVLKPGEKVWFRSRLASPPPEGHDIDVRFFNKQDIAAGGD